MNNWTLDNLRRAVDNPILFAREGVRLASWPFHQAYGRYVDFQSEGLDVINADWDNLILLDAARCDYFEELNHIEGELRRETSRGITSMQFMDRNLVGRDLHDTVYITANPHSDRIPEDTFYYVDHLYARSWDDRIGTVQPQDVVDAAREAHENHPNKRLIIHFMQPHRPYLGETAEKLRERVNLQGAGSHNDGIQIWGAVKQRDVSVRGIRKAYAESLKIALNSTSELLDAIDGKSVVSADHGEMLGERILPFTSGVWGHTEGFSTRMLREVPWLVVESENRREIQSSESIGSNAGLEEDEMKEHLEALGYY